jgi:tRNA(Ile2) C34 agmatinyltransferase TiaS
LDKSKEIHAKTYHNGTSENLRPKKNPKTQKPILKVVRGKRYYQLCGEKNTSKDSRFLISKHEGQGKWYKNL